MKTLIFALGVLLAFAFVGLFDARKERDEARQHEQIAQARYAEAVVESERVADTVVQTVTRTRTLRDSVLLLKTDTLAVERFVLQVDTLVVSCERCAAQLRTLRVVSDSLLAAKDARIASLKPTWRDRCGFVAGFGAIRDGTNVRAGPSVGVGCRVWP